MKHNISYVFSTWIQIYFSVMVHSNHWIYYGSTEYCIAAAVPSPTCQKFQNINGRNKTINTIGLNWLTIFKSVNFNQLCSVLQIYQQIFPLNSWLALSPVLFPASVVFFPVKVSSKSAAVVLQSTLEFGNVWKLSVLSVIELFFLL